MRLIFTLISLLSSFESFAQKGYNDLQVAGQLSYPTGDLQELCKRGHGFSLKGLWGIGGKTQYITTEAGYSYFDLKDKWLAEGTSAYYGGFVLYSGYRCQWRGFFIEPQAGVAFYSINGFNDITAKGVEETKTYFDWATGIGYNLGHWDFTVRYQNASVRNSTDITFIGLRLGYKFHISRKSKESVNK